MTEFPTTQAREALIRSQLHDYQQFRTHSELDEYAASLGILPETPKTVVWTYKEDDAYTISNPTKEPVIITRVTGIGGLLEDFADHGAYMADDPNTFTLGVVLSLEDGRQMAIRYESEECEIIKDLDDIEDTERERETDIIRNFVVAVCDDHRQLIWETRGLIAY